MTRWAETEELAEKWFRAHGWQFATRRGRAGHIDIENMPGLLPEVKSTKVWETRWFRDAGGHDFNRCRCDQIGRCLVHCPTCDCPPRPIKFILWRPPKFGPASVGDWPMVFRNEDGTRLLNEAGYGDGTSSDSAVSRLDVP